MLDFDIYLSALESVGFEFYGVSLANPRRFKLGQKVFQVRSYTDGDGSFLTGVGIDFAPYNSCDFPAVVATVRVRRYRAVPGVGLAAPGYSLYVLEDARPGFSWRHLVFGTRLSTDLAPEFVFRTPLEGGLLDIE